nr:MAG TPA: hypothetical protein [Caudoviricetes sp.]
MRGRCLRNATVICHMEAREMKRGKVCSSIIPSFNQPQS